MVLFVCVAACGALSSQGQTNGCSEARRLFFEPSIQLRLETTARPANSQPLPPATVSSPSPASSLELFSPLCGGRELHSSSVRPDRFYLTRSEPEFDNNVDRFVDQVFRPEVFHVGKIPVSFTPWTAIKRLNPLCLLNPFVVQASW